MQASICLWQASNQNWHDNLKVLQSKGFYILSLLVWLSGAHWKRIYRDLSLFFSATAWMLPCKWSSGPTCANAGLESGMLSWKWSLIILREGPVHLHFDCIDRSMRRPLSLCKPGKTLKFPTDQTICGSADARLTKKIICNLYNTEAEIFDHRDWHDNPGHGLDLVIRPIDGHRQLF